LQAARIGPSCRAEVGFLPYPQAESNDGRLDCLDFENFRYEITAKEIPIAAG
jgi:hypothetical protein